MLLAALLCLSDAFSCDFFSCASLANAAVQSAGATAVASTTTSASFKHANILNSKPFELSLALLGLQHSEIMLIEGPSGISAPATVTEGYRTHVVAPSFLANTGLRNGKRA